VGGGQDDQRSQMEDSKATEMTGKWESVYELPSYARLIARLGRGNGLVLCDTRTDSSVTSTYFSWIRTDEIVRDRTCPSKVGTRKVIKEGIALASRSIGGIQVKEKQA
jgi:hypothetical protein